MVQGQYRYMLLRPCYKGSTGICYGDHDTRIVQVYVMEPMVLGSYKYMLLGGHGTRAAQVYVTGAMVQGQYRYMLPRPWYKGSTGICYRAMALGQYRYMLLGPWHKDSTVICYWGHGTRAVQVYVTGAMAQGQYRYMLLGPWQ